MKPERKFRPDDKRFTKGGQRKVGAYDTPTAEKIAMGRRLVAAREKLADMSQARAAELLGYSQAVQLSNMENGNRMPPLPVLMQMARLYGTTLDYLCGLTEEMDRDPATFVQRFVAARLEGAVAQLIEKTSVVGTQVFGRLLPAALQCERLALAVLEAENAMARTRAADKRFDDLKQGGPMLARMQAAADQARAYVEQMARARRASSLSSVGREVDAAAGPFLQIPLLEEAGAADILATRAVQRAAMVKPDWPTVPPAPATTEESKA